MAFKNVDTIRIKGSRIKIHVLVASGKEGDHYVMVSPSLMVSGYGPTHDEAQNCFELNMKLFAEEFATMSAPRKETELQKLGFIQEVLHHKNFSKAYVDTNGVLRDFEAGSFQAQILEESYSG